MPSACFWMTRGRSVLQRLNDCAAHDAGFRESREVEPVVARVRDPATASALREAAGGRPLIRVRVERPGGGGWFTGRDEEGARWNLYGAAPGDCVEAEPVPQREGWAEAGATLERGPGRRDPPCPLARRCGGCHWLHLEEETQAAWRSRMLVEQAAARGIDLDALGVPLRRVASPHALRYRWRARFQSGFGDRAPTIGFHGRGHWSVVDVPGCPLLAPPLAGAYRALRAALFRLAPPDLTGFELTVLPHAPGGLLTLNPRDVPPATWPALGEALLADEHCGLAGIAVSLPRGDARPARIGAPSILGRTPAGRPVAVAARGFLQSNLAAGDLLADEVTRMAGSSAGPRVLELYAGSGFLGWPMAAAGARVEAFEDSAAAVRAAAQLPAPSASAQQPDTPGGSLRHSSGEARATWRERGRESWDVLVADPPRAGLGPLACELGPRAGDAPPRIVLVSCSLAALARDMDVLAGHGYRPAEIVQVDMFPQTRHAETVVMLERTGRAAGAGRERPGTSGSSDGG